MRGTITLAIETSNPGGGAGASGVCLGEQRAGGEARVVAARPLEPESRHDDALMPAIDALCRAEGIAPRDIGRVAVSIGPGGYTSIRIGVSTAKMIALATGAAAIPVPTALAVAMGASRVEPGELIVVALAWKRSTAWRQVFRSVASGPPVAEGAGAVAPLEVLAGEASGALLIADPELIEQLGPLLRAGTRPEAPKFDAAAVFHASLGLPAVDPAHLLPLYPREPEAVTNWRILKSR